MLLSRQQRRRICQVAGKALVKQYAKGETKAERRVDRKELSKRIFARAAAADYEPPRVVEPDMGLVVPDSRILVPDFRMVME